MTPELRDKLDATTTRQRVDKVNGPKDDASDWSTIDWRTVEDDVRRLRQRIFAASQVGDVKRVRNLQKLMLRSRANALLSVRRVTEINAGRLTAGVDRKLVLGSTAKQQMADWVQHGAAAWKPRPARRVYIPKAKGKRPLGIPVIADRCLQALAVNALEPEWEARFELRSYGFRPGRGCHDAIEAIFRAGCGKTPRRRWVLDADLAQAFDRIDHGHLLAQLGTFPARGVVQQWLKAGVVEQGNFFDTEEGTPQGGVISPLMMNVALHGMEPAAGVRYHQSSRDGETLVPGSPMLVRYADDLAVLCESRDQAEQVKARLAVWLAPRGLVFNEDKTRIVHLEDEGFDFLGFNLRRQRDKLLIKPSKAAVRRIRKRLATEVRALRGSNASAVISKLNPIIRGWAAYYRIAVSSRIFQSLDSYVWTITYRWARRAHNNKSKQWVVARYYGMYNPRRRDRWVFGDRDSGAYLAKFAWTKIVRHQMVKGRASPDDPTLADYWAARRRKAAPPLSQTALRQLQAQRGRCPLCGGLLLHADHEPQSPQQWEQWLRAVRKAIRKHAIIARSDHGTADDRAVIQLVHADCQARTDRATAGGPAPVPATP
jgi:RNA-directed DNA polymerase